MRIGVDTSVLRTNRAGSAVYVRQLVSHLQELDAGHDLVLHAFGSARAGTVRKRLERPIRDTVWMHLALPILIWRERLDLFHGMTFNAPFACNCPRVLTVLDLSLVKHPEWFDRRWFYFYTRTMLPVLVQRADRIVTISDFSKGELMDHYGLRPEQIAIVPPAVDHRVFHTRYDAVAIQGMRERLGIRGPYILSVGTLEPRKNLSRLVESYARLSRSSEAPGPSLVIAGEKGWQYQQIFETVRKFNLEDRVRFVGYVPEEDLPLLYSGAELFVYPSLYEGFGVPLVEAMACGCPVVCSNRSSMPEVVGEAAMLVDPEDPAALAASMEEVLFKPSLAAALRARGLERAQRFDWNRSARLLLDVYEEVVRSSGILR